MMRSVVQGAALGGVAAVGLHAAAAVLGLRLGLVWYLLVGALAGAWDRNAR